MSFSVVCLCMDEICFTGHFGLEPPPYPNILNFSFYNNILRNKCISYKYICCYCLKVKLTGNNYLILAYSDS